MISITLHTGEVIQAKDLSSDIIKPDQVILRIKGKTRFIKWRDIKYISGIKE